MEAPLTAALPRPKPAPLLSSQALLCGTRPATSPTRGVPVDPPQEHSPSLSAVPWAAEHTEGSGLCLILGTSSPPLQGEVSRLTLLFLGGLFVLCLL